VVKKWKEAIEQQKSKRKRDDGDEVKKEDGGKKVKTEGRCSQSVRRLLANIGSFLCSTFSFTCYTGRDQGRLKSKEGRDIGCVFISSSIAQGGRRCFIDDRRVAQNTSNG
jgi:hypothetical protein